jgi:ferredoxin
MNGQGLFKGLSVTLKRFIDSYTEDFRWLFKRYGKVEFRSSSDAKGTFTIQYPEEKLLVPEEFRYKPFLLYEEGPEGKKEIRCTSCGICAKACPTQCIWIVRSVDPATGKPSPEPAGFWIDAIDSAAVHAGYIQNHIEARRERLIQRGNGGQPHGKAMPSLKQALRPFALGDVVRQCDESTSRPLMIAFCGD